MVIAQNDRNVAVAYERGVFASGRTDDVETVLLLTLIIKGQDGSRGIYGACKRRSRLTLVRMDSRSKYSKQSAVISLAHSMFA